MTPAERLLSKLDAVTRAGDREWAARCPSHDDSRASLTVAEGHDGRALVYCHAGCTIETIVAAVGLTTRDLFLGDGPAPASPSDRTWLIRDVEGVVVARHVRVDGVDSKRFVWQQADGTLGLGGCPVRGLPLYNSEQLRTHPGERVVVCEGEKATDALAGRGILAVGTVTGAASVPHDEVLRVLGDREVLLWPDADKSGRKHMQRIATRLTALGIRVRTLDIPGAKDAEDAADFEGDAHALAALLEGLDHDGTDVTPQAAPRALTVRDLLALHIPPREYILEPILREKETAMLHAWRGVGKTYAGLEIAFAVASGGCFLSWCAPQPKRVLYIDGEMPARTMQERLAAIVSASDRANTFDPSNLRLVCADLQDNSLPSLATIEGQAFLEPLVAEADLILVDSISTLAGGGKENESESWVPMQAWALGLRRRGKSVLLLHHDGKGGQQRGTSRKEDILDLVIHLRRPVNYEAQEGARFEVHFEKSRGLHGAAVEPFEAALAVRDGRAVWTTRRLEDAQLQRAAAMYQDGCMPPEVARELNISRATAYRLKTRAQDTGLLSRDGASHGSQPQALRQ